MSEPNFVPVQVGVETFLNIGGGARANVRSSQNSSFGNFVFLF